MRQILLYPDVTNNRVGINNPKSQSHPDVIGTTRTQNLTLQAELPQMAGIKFENNTPSTTASNYYTRYTRQCSVLKKLRVGDIDIDDNVSQTTSNSNLELRPKRYRKSNCASQAWTYKVIYMQQAIYPDGNITLGDADTDDVVFQGLVASNIIPTQDGVYSLGNSNKRWKELNSFNVTATNLNVTNLTSPGMDFTQTHDNMIYVAENGSDTALGNRPRVLLLLLNMH